jgi:hypothetical protein
VKTSLSLFLTMFLLPSLCIAQVTGIRELGLIQTDTGWEETFENLTGRPIAVLHVTFDCFQDNGHHTQVDNDAIDPLYNFSASPKPIQPGGSYTFKSNGHPQCSGGVNAVIFSDSRSEGDREQIDRIYEQRRGVYKGLEFTIPLVAQIASGDLETQKAIAILDRQLHSTANDMSRSMVDRGGEVWPYEMMLSVLRHQTSFRTPSDTLPNREPRVEDLAKSNNIPKEQALAIIVLSKFKEWQAALEGHLDPLVGN